MCVEPNNNELIMDYMDKCMELGIKKTHDLLAFYDLRKQGSEAELSSVLDNDEYLRDLQGTDVGTGTGTGTYTDTGIDTDTGTSTSTYVKNIIKKLYDGDILQFKPLITYHINKNNYQCAVHCLIAIDRFIEDNISIVKKIPVIAGKEFCNYIIQIFYRDVRDSKDVPYIFYQIALSYMILSENISHETGDTFETCIIDLCDISIRLNKVRALIDSLSECEWFETYFHRFYTLLGIAYLNNGHQDLAYEYIMLGYDSTGIGADTGTGTGTGTDSGTGTSKYIVFPYNTEGEYLLVLSVGCAINGKHVPAIFLCSKAFEKGYTDAFGKLGYYHYYKNAQYTHALECFEKAFKLGCNNMFLHYYCVVIILDKLNKNSENIPVANNTDLYAWSYTQISTHLITILENEQTNDILLQDTLKIVDYIVSKNCDERLLLASVQRVWGSGHEWFLNSLEQTIGSDCLNRLFVKLRVEHVSKTPI